MHGAGEVLGVEPLLLHSLRKLLPRLGHHLHQGQAALGPDPEAAGLEAQGFGLLGWGDAGRVR